MAHLSGRFLIAVWLATALCVAVAQGSPAFLSALGDVPLAPGLAEVPGGGVTFDDPTGCIVEAFAAGAAGRNEVAAFYRSTLPVLGWTALDAGRYRREGKCF